MADNLKEICCPACGKKMHKVFMTEQNLNLDVCLDGCGGIYFDNREFKKFDESFEDITPLTNAYQGKTFNEVDDNELRVCPVCGTKMVKHFSSSKQEVQVDECYSCGGIFLDYNELDAIRAEYTTELNRDLDAMKNLYYHVGDELRESNENHSKIYDNSFLRKFVSGMVNSYNMNKK